MRPNHLLLLAALLSLSQCKSSPTPAPVVNPADQLPPATQTGQRTFGCLVNGQAWTPAGNPFAGPLFSTAYMNGRLGISVNHITVVNGINSFQRMGFSIAGATATGRYLLVDSLQKATFENFDNSCTFSTSASQVGTVVITRLDVVNRIVSGTFAFTLETPGCGKVTVTDGRFDSPF